VRASGVAFKHVERNPHIIQENHPGNGAGGFFLLKALPETVSFVLIPQRLGRLILAVSPVSGAVVFGFSFGDREPADHVWSEFNAHRDKPEERSDRQRKGYSSEPDKSAF